ncbi:uncharacterized protein K452DRAFT_297021 [Aplosporella prunicola CBS 121167]|uniref:Uncharacterized protein n=1 Tax=Aplosporella prunicola CBS 121167 TaxID=1176127 RepID=A0A6A6BI19_9PEZI|nr:uncharacterized protein K452DRAFT_297021 [Aplosporella prunicola CBS 121167]KAF2143258.1 hypothetical protein K452DRAFT_297021 [Aplosporella prunicola CBS 121167]
MPERSSSTRLAKGLRRTRSTTSSPCRANNSSTTTTTITTTTTTTISANPAPKRPARTAANPNSPTAVPRTSLSRSASSTSVPVITTMRAEEATKPPSPLVRHNSAKSSSSPHQRSPLNDAALAAIDARAQRRVQELERALAAAQAQARRSAAEAERLRVLASTTMSSSAPTSPTTPSSTTNTNTAPLPVPAPAPARKHVPSIFGSPPSPRSTTSSNSSSAGLMGLGSDGGSSTGNETAQLVLEAHRHCAMMEDRLVFQKQIVQLRDRIYAQQKEAARERRAWAVEREGLVREVRERDDRIRALEEQCAKRMHVVRADSMGEEVVGK